MRRRISPVRTALLSVQTQCGTNSSDIDPIILQTDITKQSNGRNRPVFCLALTCFLFDDVDWIQYQYQCK